MSIHDLVREGIDLERGPTAASETAASETAASETAASDDAFWQGLCDQGIELWLDVADDQPWGEAWTAPFTGLLLRGLDADGDLTGTEQGPFLSAAQQATTDLPDEARVLELAFAITARRALRAAQRLGAKVSVPLHPGALRDEQTALSYAVRLHDIYRQGFVVGVPFTPTGIMVTRQLRDQKIPVNMTDACSARQSYVATMLASPTYLTFSAGAIGDYLSQNNLPDGPHAGEKAALASQQEIAAFTLALPQTKTRQIVADIPGPAAIDHLVGVDALALSPPLVSEARQQLEGRWTSRPDAEYQLRTASSSESEELGLPKLWEVAPAERKFVEQMILRTPQDSEQLIEAAHRHEVGDLFPRLSDDELAQMQREGRVPQHRTWENKFNDRQWAIDSLLTQAMVEHTAARQRKFDDQLIPKAMGD
jgi:transaldolase